MSPVNRLYSFRSYSSIHRLLIYNRQKFQPSTTPSDVEESVCKPISPELETVQNEKSAYWS